MLGYMTYGNNSASEMILITWGSLLVLAIYIAVIMFVVFKPGYVIDKLKLDRGFREETISLNIRMNTILTIAVIVIGGIMFIDALPHLAREVIMFMRGTEPINEYPNTESLIFFFFKTLIGYLLMTNSKRVVGFIVRKEEEVEA